MKNYFKVILLSCLGSCGRLNSHIIQVNGKYIDQDTIQFFSIGNNDVEFDDRINNMLGLYSLKYMKGVSGVKQKIQSARFIRAAALVEMMRSRLMFNR